MRKTVSLWIVASGMLLSCGTDPAFHQVSRDTGADALQASGVKPQGEGDANAAAPRTAVSPAAEGTVPAGVRDGVVEGATVPVVVDTVTLENPSSIAHLPSDELDQHFAGKNDEGSKEAPKSNHPALTDSNPVHGVEDVYHPAAPVVPEGKTLLKLSVKQLQTNAWYKNCLTVSLNGQTQKVGCNKDPESIGRWVYLVADKAPACNHVGVKIETYFNQGDICSKRSKDGLGCEGPYSDKPDQVRSTSVVADREFYKVYDALNIDQRDPLIKANFDWNMLKNDMVAYSAPGNRPWLRVFFEDLSKETLDLARKDPSKADSNGINFSDYVLDIKGEDVNVNVEGMSAGCK